MAMSEDRIEEELRKALRREQAPSGFAERVLARASAENAARPGFWHSLFALVRVPKFRVAFATAALVVVLGSAWEYRRYEREREAEQAAAQQLMLALRITGSKLHFAQQKVNEAGSRQFGPTSDSEVSQ